MKNKFLTAVSAVAIGALALTGCSGDSGGDSGEGGGEPITINAGWVPTIHSTHWATTSQFLEDENVTINLSPFKTNNEMMVAMQGGSLDMMTMGYNNTITALDRGDVNFQYVAGVSEGGTRILVREGVEVESWDDIKGLTVGTAQGSTQYQQLVLAAEANGIDIVEDTDFVNIGSAPDMILSLMNGDVDVISVWEPSASEGLISEYGYEVPAISDTFYDDSFRLNSGLAVSNDFIESNPEAVDAVIAALGKAEEKVNSDSQWWVDEFMKLSSSDPEVLNEAITNVTAVTAVDVAEVEAIAAGLYNIGLVGEDYSDRVPELIYNGGNE